MRTLQLAPDDGCSKALERQDSPWKLMSSCWGCFEESHADHPFVGVESGRSGWDVGSCSKSQLLGYSAPERSTKNGLDGLEDSAPGASLG